MEKEREKQSYSVINNVKYIYKTLFEVYPKMRLCVAGKIILDIGSRVINTSALALVVACITDIGKISSYLMLVAGLFLAYMLIGILSLYTRVWGDFYYNQTQNCNFLMKLVEKSLHADYVNVESPSMQRLMNRASHAVNMYRNGVSQMYQHVPMLLSNIVGIILFSLGISFFDWRILIVIVLMTISNEFFDRRARKYIAGQMDEQYKVWGRFYYLQKQTTSVENGKDIRIYNMADWFKSGFDRLGKFNYRLAVGKSRKWGDFFVSDVVFSALRDLLAYGILITQVLDGTLSIAQFTLGLGMISSLSDWISALQHHASKCLEGNIMLCEYRKMIDYPNQFKREEGNSIPIEWKETFPDIEFQNVSFRYEDEGEYILKNISFTIRSGEKIALVGHNGAGKTTLVKLLCGFYHPTEGRILIGGYPLEDMNLDEYHELLATVFQDINTIPVSIASNVSGVIENQTDLEKVRECLQRADLWKEVESLERQELTSLTQSFDPEGILLSGGMMQKLMLARCMYKDAPMVILDEPTAALDPIAESNMYEEYQRTTKGKSALFISHRLASTKFCDRILYIEEGRLIEEGTHDELLKKQGKYAEVFEVQSKYYKEGGMENEKDQQEKEIALC